MSPSDVKSHEPTSLCADVTSIFSVIYVFPSKMRSWNIFPTKNYKLKRWHEIKCASIHLLHEVWDRSCLSACFIAKNTHWISVLVECNKTCGSAHNGPIHDVQNKWNNQYIHNTYYGNLKKSTLVINSDSFYTLSIPYHTIFDELTLYFHRNI
jgi:hypothetical protein